MQPTNRKPVYAEREQNVLTRRAAEAKTKAHREAVKDCCRSEADEADSTGRN